jgi:hypothetical protein
MQMSDGEILTSYRQAKDKSKQVQILADLNDCTIADIVRILIARGISPKAFRIRKRVSNEKNTTSKAEKPDPVKEKKVVYAACNPRKDLRADRYACRSHAQTCDGKGA